MTAGPCQTDRYRDMTRRGLLVGNNYWRILIIIDFLLFFNQNCCVTHMPLQQRPPFDCFPSLTGILMMPARVQQSHAGEWLTRQPCARRSLNLHPLLPWVLLLLHRSCPMHPARKQTYWLLCFTEYPARETMRRGGRAVGKILCGGIHRRDGLIRVQ